MSTPAYLAVLGVLPWLPTEPIRSFRAAYDPTANVVQPHITLVFPVPVSFGRDRLAAHARHVMSSHHAFDIRLMGLQKAWDHWLFLLVQEGREELISIHDELYTGMLEEFLWTEHPFVPHVSLGLFAEHTDTEDALNPFARSLDSARYEAAVQEANSLNLDFSGRFDTVRVVEIDDKVTRVTLLEEIGLRRA
jgi:2'-5' RNA ligase